uniref:Putative secreted peptide n=1 Tax=Anopheles braziliensis TaxID=58242 RepID=A0A2M3ZWS3_9DIPT
MTTARRMGTIHFFTVFALVAAHTRALAADAVPVAIAIRYFAFVVPQRAFLALPARITLALAVDVFTPLGAQYRADTFTAIIATETGIALAVT